MINGAWPIPNFLMMHAVISLKVGAKRGSGFFYKHSDQFFIITATHVLEDFSQLSVDIALAGTYLRLPCTCVHRSEGDISVLLLDLNGIIDPQKLTTPTLPSSEGVSFGGKGLPFGQPLAILGFPDGLHPINLPKVPKASPILRVGAFAGIITVDGISKYIIDARTNEGFSGGPVFWSDSRRTHILGVVHARNTRSEPIHCGTELYDGFSTLSDQGFTIADQIDAVAQAMNWPISEL